MFDSVPGLYSLDADSTPPSCDKQKYLRALPNVPWRATGSPVEEHCSRYILPIFGNKILFGCPGGSVVKNPPVNAGNIRDTGSIPGLGRFPRRRKWQPTPVFLPGASHGPRSLVDHTVRGVAKSWTQLKRLSMYTGRRNVGSSLTRD